MCVRVGCLVALLPMLGCVAGGADPCVDDRCDGAESRAELIAELDGYGDPISDFLRAAVTDEGTLTDLLASYVPDERLRTQILVDNPQVLYDFD